LFTYYEQDMGKSIIFFDYYNNVWKMVQYDSC
jgi:hypothetical protein